MKRIIAIFSLFLAFSFGANAQEAKMLSVSNIEESLKMDLVNLLQMRKDDVNNSKTQEEKQVVFERYTLKLLGAFNEEQIETLKKDKELFNRLTQFTTK